MKIISNKAWIFNEDDINTDVIFPGKYTYEPLTPDQMAQYAMEDLEPKFAKNVQAGDIIVAGSNFGCGSSREQAVKCLKAAGIVAIIAKSFARIYFRNAINQALPVVECPTAVDWVFNNSTDAEKASYVIEMAEGRLTIKDKEFKVPKFDEQAMKIFEVGGLVEFTKKRMKKE